MITELEEIKRLLPLQIELIGVAGIPEALDEYDSYAFHLFVISGENSDASNIADYLDRVATEHMELPAPENSAEIATRIISIHLSYTGI